jgi:hypothetical protein
MFKSFYMTELAKYDAETGTEMHNFWHEHKTFFI